MVEDVRRMVGDNVKRQRIAAKITQAELANRVGVDRAYISGLEQGQRNITVISLWRVAEALDVPIKLFFEPRKSRSQN
jgi:transcriptional regulator with XRE-family HTH domain